MSAVDLADKTPRPNQENELKVTMTVDGATVCTIRIFEDLVPEFARQLREALPSRGVLTHARIAGDMVFWNLPFSSPWENLFRTEEVGAIRRAALGHARGAVGWYSPRQQLCVVYGDDLADENLRISYVGEVAEGDKDLALAGLRTWIKPGQLVELTAAS